MWSLDYAAANQAMRKTLSQLTGRWEGLLIALSGGVTLMILPWCKLSVYELIRDLSVSRRVYSSFRMNV